MEEKDGKLNIVSPSATSTILDPMNLSDRRKRSIGQEAWGRREKNVGTCRRRAGKRGA
jgi:hypothetical protein